jgi:uncharacterized protein (DUF2147 family)
MIRLFIVSILITCTSTIFAQKPDAILGTWLPGSGKAHVKIEKVGNKYFGTVIWLKEPIDPETNKPKLDKNNPAKVLQSYPIIGTRLLKDLVFEDGEWSDGTVYDPENGKTYSCTVTLVDANTIDMRGYIGFSFIGRSDTWKRVN